MRLKQTSSQHSRRRTPTKFRPKVNEVDSEQSHIESNEDDLTCHEATEDDDDQSNKSDSDASIIQSFAEAVHPSKSFRRKDQRRN